MSIRHRRISAISISPSLVARTIGNRVKSVTKARTTAKVTTAESITARREELVAFYECYENFVECVCDAAQYGPLTRLEDSYTRNRSAALDKLNALGQWARAFVRLEGKSEEIIDPFSELFAPENLADFLHSDDGLSIERITLTREALNLYGEHLRQLAARIS